MKANLKFNIFGQKYVIIKQNIMLYIYYMYIAQKSNTSQKYITKIIFFQKYKIVQEREKKITYFNIIVININKLIDRAKIINCFFKLSRINIDIYFVLSYYT